MQTRHFLAATIARLAVLGLTVLGLTACGASNPSEPSEPTTCNLNTDCAAGSYCTVGGQCIADSTGPVITLTSPSAGVFVTETSVQLAGSVSDAGAGVRSASWSTDGATFQDLVLTGGAFAEAIPVPSADGALLALTVRALDKVGNASTRAVTIVVDSRAPVVAVTAPEADGACAGSCSGAVASLADDSVVLSGTVADGGRLALSNGLVALVLDGATVVAGPTELATLFGAWRFTWSSLPVANGKPYTFRLTATDMAGNSASAERVIYVDRVAPALAIATPVASSTLATATANLSGSADDGTGSGVAAVEVSTDGVAFAPAGRAGTQYTATVSLPEIDRAPFAITVRATDLAGNATTAVRSIFVDRRPPALAITTPALDGSCPGTGCTGAIINVATPLPYVFSGTTADAGGLRAGDGLVATVLQGGVVVTGPTVLTPSAGTWSFPWTALSVGGTFYTFRLVATDPSGNSITSSRIVFVDRQQPTVSIASPAAGHVAATPTLSVSGDLHDEFAVASVAASIDGTNFTALTATGLQFAGAIAVPDVDRFSLTLTVRVADTAGNQASATVPIVADRRGPALAIGTPAQDFSCGATCSGAVVRAADGTYAFAGTATDPSGLAASGAIVGRVFKEGVQVFGPVSASGSPWTLSWSSLPSGVNGAEYRFEVVAMDSAGNSTSASRRVWVDRVVPTVSFTSPTPGQLVAASSLSVAGSLSDALARVEISTDGVTWRPLSLVGLLLGTTLDVPAGDRQAVTIRVRATDPSGNQSTGTVQYFADRQGPAIAITAPAQDASCAPLGSCSGAVIRAGDDSYPFVGTTTDPSGLAASGGLVARIYQRSALVHGPVAVTGSPWTVAWSAPAYDNGLEYVFEVVATDAAGNQTAASRRVWVDRVAPTLLFSSPSPGQLVGAGTLNVSGTVSNEYGVSCEISTDRDSEIYTAAMLGALWSGDVDVPPVDRQSVTVTARVKDAVGNEGTETVQYFADRVGPALAIVTPGADYSCPALSPCTGAKVLAVDTSYAFGGTAVDPSGLATSNPIRAGISTGTTQVFGPLTQGGSPWAFTWAPLPSANGVPYRFEVWATDLAGNTTSVSRFVWVDTVPPAVSMAQAGKRLVPRTEPLAAFSEPMDVGSVRAATTLTPAAASMGTYGSADGRSFSFADAGGLAYYTPYRMDIGTGAKDRAGNPIAGAASQVFLSERAPFPAGLARMVAPGADSPASPRLGVDPDGKPLLVYQSLGLLRSAAWDGRSSEFPSALMLLWPGSGVPGWPTDLVVTGSTIEPTDLTLSTARMFVGMYDVDYSGYRWILHATSPNGVDWDYGWIEPTPSAAGPMFSSYKGCMKAPEACATNDRTLALMTVDPPEAYGWLMTNAGWSSEVEWDIPDIKDHQGAAVFTFSENPDALDPGTLRYCDYEGLAPTSIENPAATHVSGRAQLWLNDCQDSGGVWWACRSGSAWLASNQDRVLVDPPLSTWVETRLGVACNSSPLDAASPWKHSWARLDELHPPEGSTETTGVVTAIRTALTASRFAAAVALSRENEHFIKVVTASNADADCTSAPALTVNPTVITDAKDPGVAFDEGGNLWVAYVKVSTGDLMVVRLP